MGRYSCPYCKEEIEANAIICRYCHTRLRRTREEMALSVIAKRLELSRAISKPSYSPCKAACYSDYYKHRSKKLLNECLDDCKAVEVWRAVAERLETELFDTFIDVIWEGGNIDPVSFEKSVRERFSRPHGRG